MKIVDSMHDIWYIINNMNKFISKLRDTLFWDVNSGKLNPEKDALFIIGRVLDYGNLQEWKVIKNFYGVEKIKNIIPKHIFSDIRSLNFWSIILDIPKEELKCTKNPSLKTPNAFLKR